MVESFIEINGVFLEGYNQCASAVDSPTQSDGTGTN